MTASATERYAALTAWVEEAGGSLHPSVEIYVDEDTEGSLRVKPGSSISAGDSIVKLPLVKSLSFLNAISGHPDFPAAQGLGVATPKNHSSKDGTDYFPTEFLRETPPHVIGRFFLIQQYLLGDESLWAPYIQTLPQPAAISTHDDDGNDAMTSADELLPCAWPPSDLEFLRGTNAEIAVHEINATLDSEYAAAAKLLGTSSLASHGEAINLADYTPSLYKWAYCIFASRSFRQSLTIPGATALSLSSRPDDFSVLLPLFDMGNHHPQAKTAWKTPQDSGTANAAVVAFCELQTGQPYASGQQVFNNYGPSKTNAELLLGYGFILAEDEGTEGRSAGFHNDYVHVKTRPGGGSGGGGSDIHQQQLASTHLVSLHPISHPSSLAARARSVTDPDPERIMSCYTHVQDSLVAALYEAICQARGISPAISGSGSQEGSTKGGVTLPQILAGDIPEELTDEIINALGTKLSIDLEKIEAAEAEMQASGKAEPRNGNQQIAFLYRNQCKRVLENALASLSGDEYEVEEDEEE